MSKRKASDLDPPPEDLPSLDDVNGSPLSVQAAGTDDGAVKRRRTDDGIDFNERRELIGRDIVSDLTDLAAKVRQISPRDNNVLALSAEKKTNTVVFTYLGLRHIVSPPLSWTKIPAPITTWTDEKYAEQAGSRCRWDICVLQGDLTPALLNAFAVDLEKGRTSQVDKLTSAILEFISQHPHRDYLSYSLYFGLIQKVFLEHHFDREDLRLVINGFIEKRLKWKTYDKFQTHGQKCIAILNTPTIPNLSKLRKTAIKEIKDMTDPIHAATLNLLSFLNSED